MASLDKGKEPQQGQCGLLTRWATRRLAYHVLMYINSHTGDLKSPCLVSGPPRTSQLAIPSANLVGRGDHYSNAEIPAGMHPARFSRSTALHFAVRTWRSHRARPTEGNHLQFTQRKAAPAELAMRPVRVGVLGDQ